MAISGMILLGAGGATIAASVTVGFALLSTTALTYFLTTAAIGLAINALTPKPKMPTLGSIGSSASGGYTVNTKGAALDHQIIYGDTKVGGAVVFDGITGTNNKYLHRAIAFAGHEIDGFGDIYIDDAKVVSYSGGVTYKYTYIKLRGFGIPTAFGVSDATAEVYDVGVYTTTSDPSVFEVAADLGITVTVGDTLWLLTNSIAEDGFIGNVEYPDGTISNRFSGKIRINKHVGTSDQLADADMVADIPDWTSFHRLQGIAYLYCRFSFDADTFPSGVPVITSRIRGKKVYDPRTGTTVWNNNPALCLRDYLTTAGYGLGEEAENIDDTIVSAAADVCDQELEFSLKRYSCNGSFLTAVPPYDLLGDILTSMGGLVWYAQGKWRMKPAYWTAPVLALDEDDLRSSVNLSTRKSRRDNFNTVKGIFRGEETNWQPTDYPEVTNQDFIDADGGQVSVVDIDMPYTTDSLTARRIALIALERNRQQLTVSASFGMRAFQVQVGDNVTLTNTRFGWADKEFEVTSWTFGLSEGLDLQVQMTLREVSESVFDEINDGIVYERDNTTLLSIYEVPDVGLSAESTTQVLREKLTNIINLTVTSGRPEGIDRVEVEFKKSSDSIFTSIGTGELGLYRAVDLETADYDFRARAINTFGVKGEWATLTDVAADGLLEPPSDVQGFSAEVNDNVIHLEWEPVPDLDLSYYRIRYSKSETGSTYANASTVVDRVPRPANSVSVPARSGTYHIRAIDKSGVSSVNYSSVVVPAEALLPATTTLTQTEDPTFGGTKTGCSVISTNLRITDPSVAPSTATYDFEQSSLFATGPELVTNGSSISGTTGWTAFNAVISEAGGLLIVDDSANAGSNSQVYQVIPTVIGKTYTVSGAYEDTDAGFIWVDASTPPSLFGEPKLVDIGFTASVPSVPFSASFVATSTSTTVSLVADQTGVAKWSSISVKEVTGYNIDTGAARLVRARVDYTTFRQDNSAGLWDDVAGTFDTLAGLFDSFTGDAQFSDTNVKTYISITQDDPAVATPTWTDYQLFRAGNYYGRAFRFRVVLSSTAANVTPSLIELAAIVEYE